MNLDVVNSLSLPDARAAFLRCCGSSRWAEQMASRCPFATASDVLSAAREIWQGLEPNDWLEAFAAHPRIGDLETLRTKYGSSAEPAREQAGVAGAPEEVLHALAHGNRAYEARFGYIFIVCATGKSAAEMLALLQQRLGNDPEQELLLAAAEQEKIMLLRLRKVGL
jgi:2-oxo-4-hydroxy-4-carboxy-5-ureidoimidazoline decarboxylase